MANWSDPRPNASAYVQVGAHGAQYDAGLRSYMLSVYNYMASAVLLTGLISFGLFQTGLINLFFQQVMTRQGLVAQPTGLGFIAILAPLAFGLPLSFSRGGMKLGTLQVLFWGYAIALGLSFSSLFISYASASIAQAFFAAAAGFAGLSLYGYTTQRDLSPFRSFLLIGVIGILVAMLLNAFVFQSTQLDMIISIVGVLVFAGLTAFKTQMIKETYDQVAGTEMQGKVAVLGAFQLYVTFVNLFLFLLRIFGNSRN